MKVIFLLFCILFACLATTEVYKWKHLDFDFENDADHTEFIQKKHYESCMLGGVKVDLDGNYFVSVPRWKPNVPATLSKVILNKEGNPILKPFPSWKGNKEGDADALQSVLGFEIDSCNRIWVLDQGRITSKTGIPGSIKLSIYDAKTGDRLRKFVFPDKLVSLENSFLNDIVIDEEKMIAYIADSGLAQNTDNQGQMIIYDYHKNTARRTLFQQTSTLPNTDLRFKINEVSVLKSEPMMTGNDGIGLSPDRKTLYFCPLTSRHTYLIPTEELLKDQSDEEMNKHVIDMGSKDTTTDGMAVDAEGYLYITALEFNGILKTKAKNPTSAARVDATLIASDDDMMHWTDTLGFDHKGNLVATTNRLNLFLDGSLDFLNDYNFRIMKVDIGSDSYMSKHADDVKCPKPHHHKNQKAIILAIVCVGIVVCVALGLLFSKMKKKKTNSLTLPIMMGQQ